MNQCEHERGATNVGVEAIQSLYPQRLTQATDRACIRVLCVDYHPLLREGVSRVLSEQPDMVVVAQAATGREGIRQFREHRPDVTLLDLRLPDMSGAELIRSIRAEFREARTVVLTTSEGDAEIRLALGAGARGYLLKTMSPDHVLRAIRMVHAGKRSVAPEVAAQLAEHACDIELTAREVEVLRHVAGGNRNRDIASNLSISEDTVKAHIRSIMSKLGASGRTQALAIALRRGIVHL
ncbi:response regulator transcription factor [uncultured Paludibaculum sp.]|uniref:response regulator transcription factor n=1 Tax=uncultured Paludibaculum sp. TaxID=1765020 RepID=UPI002AAB82EC|nr:response regulator transcription factor [uncultured Paludibaculum sp.]